MSHEKKIYNHIGEEFKLNRTTRLYYYYIGNNTIQAFNVRTHFGSDLKDLLMKPKVRAHWVETGSSHSSEGAYLLLEKYFKDNGM